MHSEARKRQVPAPVPSALTDADREALHVSVDLAENCECCGSDYGWPHVYAEVERILAARLAAQREQIATAIEHGPHRLGHDVWVVCSCVRCEATLAAARIVRGGVR